MIITQATTMELLVRKKVIITGTILLFLIISLWGVWRTNGLSFSTSPLANNQVDLLSAGWDYMPGVTPQADGLHVTYLGRAIVKQDGSPGQTNPAANLYGTHLRALKDFTLTANMKDISGAASFRLYSSPPIIQDEFRVEPKGLDLTLNGSTLTVTQWRGYKNENVRKQKPEKTDTTTVSPQANNTISIQRKGDTLSLSFNGKPVKKLSYGSTFSTDIWFGLSAVNPGDKWTLASLSARPDAPEAITAVNTQDLPAPSAPPSDSFQSIASSKRPEFYVGAATSLAPSVADMPYRNLAYGGNFGTITTENVLKWQFIHPQPDVYDFKEADALVDIARKSNMRIQGHTLVFGEANPKWVQDLPTATAADKEKVKQIMVDHINHTVSHFKDRVYAWDVVNEPLDDYDANPSALRPHKWFTAMGEEYIALAFKAARAADPNAKLYINDYGLEQDGERWNAILALVTKLKNQNVPIDGVGFEAHVYEVGDEINPKTLQAHMQALAKIGVSSHVSEMDVHDDSGTDAQAKQYADVIAACIREPSCTSWTTWGVTDHYNLYESDAGVLQYGTDFLWNNSSAPTPAVSAIQKALKEQHP